MLWAVCTAFAADRGKASAGGTPTGRQAGGSGSTAVNNIYRATGRAVRPGETARLAAPERPFYAAIRPVWQRRGARAASS